MLFAEYLPVYSPCVVLLSALRFLQTKAAFYCCSYYFYCCSRHLADQTHFANINAKVQKVENLFAEMDLNPGSCLKVDPQQHTYAHMTECVLNKYMHTHSQTHTQTHVYCIWNNFLALRSAFKLSVSVKSSQATATSCVCVWVSERVYCWLCVCVCVFAA